MERLVEKRLCDWKDSPNRKPLLIFGARQIGKTYSMLSFGKEHYANVVYCNFENASELRDVFSRNLDPERIVGAISAMYGVQIQKGSTLLLFDEIQACERALTSLKYFHEQANGYHIIAAGSLLGLALNRGQYSFPVGQVDTVTMHPLTFEEFLLATGHREMAELIKSSFSSLSPFPLHEKALELYRSYLVVGGYPSSVNVYLNTGDFNAVRAEQNSISDAYIADMAKYASPSDMMKSIEVYNSIYAQLSKPNSKFQYSVVNSKARAKDYETALTWLQTAGVVLKCGRISEGKYPINIYEDLMAFKAYYSDVGLLTMRMALSANSILHSANLSDKARGMMAESYVAEQLSGSSFPLHYWTSGNSAEVDFVIQLEDEAIPVEVKYGENVRAKSLQTYIEKYHPKYAIRISTHNFGFQNGIKSIPLYAAFCLKRD